MIIQVEIIDTRAMTIASTSMKAFDKATMEQHTYNLDKLPTYYIDLPTKPYLAVHIRRS